MELTDERRAHIEAEHPDLLPDHLDELIATVSEPDEVLPSLGGHKLLFVRWVATIGYGKYAVVVVLPAQDRHRHYVVTAYITRHQPT